jgi:hypothetical protein
MAPPFVNGRVASALTMVSGEGELRWMLPLLLRCSFVFGRSLCRPHATDVEFESFSSRVFFAEAASFFAPGPFISGAAAGPAAPACRVAAVLRWERRAVAHPSFCLCCLFALRVLSLGSALRGSCTRRQQQRRTAVPLGHKPRRRRTAEAEAEAGALANDVRLLQSSHLLLLRTESSPCCRWR